MTSQSSVSRASRGICRGSEVVVIEELINYHGFNFLGKIVKLVSFVPFRDAAHALEVANDVSEGPLYIPLAFWWFYEGQTAGIGAQGNLRLFCCSGRSCSGSVRGTGGDTRPRKFEGLKRRLKRECCGTA